jgi:hypothetical protein
MLKRTRETVRAVAETLGAISPTLVDAQAGAEQRRQALTDAQQAVANAEEALQAAHDRSADDGELRKAEAVLADTRLSAERSQLAYAAAERRLNEALAANADKVKSAARAHLAEALAIRQKAAARIDTLSAELAEQAHLFNAQIGTLNECARDGVATNAGRTTAQRLIEHALQKAGALPSHWIGDPAGQPSAVDLALRDEGAIVMPQPVAA